MGIRHVMSTEGFSDQRAEGYGLENEGRSLLTIVLGYFMVSENGHYRLLRVLSLDS